MTKRKNIVLIGMMGSWKTTVGTLLAESLDHEFIDLDHEIERESGFSVRDLFEWFGEKKFRDLETAILRTAIRKENCLISTGGGTVVPEENRRLLSKYGTVIFLQARPEILAGRIRNAEKRPLLQGKGEKAEIIRKIWTERKHLYQDTADYIIDTNEMNPEQIVERIRMYSGKKS